MKGVMRMDSCKECGKRITCAEDDFGCLCEKCWGDRMEAENLD